MILDSQAQKARLVGHFRGRRFGFKQQAGNLARQTGFFSNSEMRLEQVAVQASGGVDEIGWRGEFRRRRFRTGLDFVP